MGQGTIACMRYILCAFTLVFVIFGILLLYTGFSTFVSLNQYSLVVHNQPDNVTIILLVLGFLIFFISFLGCCGAFTGNDFMLRTFSFIITLLLLLEIISVVSVFTFRKTIHESLESGLHEAINKYNHNDSASITNLIDDVQKRFGCCGADGPNDWSNSTANLPPNTLARTCCKDMTDSDAFCPKTRPFYDDGCVNIITRELKNSLSYLGFIVISVIVLQVIGLVFSCILTGQRRNYDYV